MKEADTLFDGLELVQSPGFAPRALTLSITATPAEASRHLEPTRLLDQSARSSAESSRKPNRIVGDQAVQTRNVEHFFAHAKGFLAALKARSTVRTFSPVHD
jgi:hypothetical protein